MKKKARQLLLWFVAVASLACGLTTNPVATLWSAPETAEPTATVKPYPLGPTTAQSGLGQLNSYRANLSLDFSGTRNGEPVTGQIRSLTEVTRQPPALHYYLETGITTPDRPIAPGPAEFFNISGQIFVKKAAGEPWLTFTGRQVSPDSLGFFEFDRLITLPPTVPNPPRLETLNGLNVERYAFDQRDLPVSNIIFEQAQGDVWLAAPGNYVMQYLISATVKIVIPDPKAHLFDQGQFNLRYTLTDINADLTITPPATGVTGSDALNNLPRLPDAEIVTVFPTLIEYTSAISAISATLFYRDQLSALDWSEDSAAIFNEKAQLNFSQAGQNLTVLITPAGEGDKIKVVVSLAR